MDTPNLFLINQSFPDNPYYVIGIDNNFMVLSTEDMGCFSGDCFCCADDGSDKPTVNIEYYGGLFTYSTENSDFSTLYQKFLGFSGPYNSNILEYAGDITDFINVNGISPGNLVLYAEPPYGYGDGCGFVFGITATNQCGTTNIESGCHCIFCDAYYVVDCITQKIKIIKILQYANGINYDPQYIEEFYDLGDVPNIDFNTSNGCGNPCTKYEEAACIYSKNSLVLEFSGFEDVDREYYSPDGFEYFRVVTSGITNLNGTLIFPVYVKSCGDTDSELNDINGPIPTIGQIVYSRPLEILKGSVTTTIQHKIFRADFMGNPTILQYESNSVTVENVSISNYNQIYQDVTSHTGTWNDYYYGTSGTFPPGSDSIKTFGFCDRPQISFPPIPYDIPPPVYCGSNREIDYYYCGTRLSIIPSLPVGHMLGYYAKL